MLISQLIAVGCGACGSDPADPAPSDPIQSEDSVGDEAQTNREGPRDPDPPLQIAVRAEASDASAIRLVIESRGTAAAHLNSQVRVEQATGSEWTAVSTGFVLRDTCETATPECVTLVPGAEYRPPVWRGQLGDGQCACTRCGDAPVGRYRFVISSCDGQQRVEGEPFELAR